MKNRVFLELMDAIEPLDNVLNTELYDKSDAGTDIPLSKYRRLVLDCDTIAELANKLLAKKCKEPRHRSQLKTTQIWPDTAAEAKQSHQPK